MGKSAAKYPDPDPRIGEAALLQAETGVEYLNFAKDAFGISTERQKEIDALVEEVTRRQMQLAEGQFDFTKNMTREQLALAKSQDAFARDTTTKQLAMAKDAAKFAKEITNRQMKVFDEQAGWARDDRKRYESVFQPIEDQFVKEATEYGSEERQAAAAAEAKADVQTSAAAAKAQAQREAAALGINPNSGRFAGIQRAGEMGTALAEAGAANNARTATRDKGLALKADVVNLGRGLPAQSAQAASVGLAAGNAAAAGNNAAAGMQINTAGLGLNNITGSTALGINAGNNAIANMGSAATTGINTAGLGLNNANSANAQYLASTGIMGGGFQGQMAGYGGMASTLNNQYQTQMQGYQAQLNANAAGAAGIGQALGGLFGLFLSDEDAKKDKAAIPEGEALDAVNAMPVEEWTYKEGMADEGRHVGTYAQDFQKATGKGDGRTIPVQDAIGVTMKAVQDLDRKVDRIASAVGIKAANTNRKTAGIRRAAA